MILRMPGFSGLTPCAMRLRLLPVLILGCALPCTASTPAVIDFWQVRGQGSGANRVVESLSVINRAAPARESGTAPTTHLLAQREQGALSVRLHADAATAALLQAPGVDFDLELDTAMRWLARLRTPQRRSARIDLHLMAPDWQVRMLQRHPAGTTTVVELAVPVQPPQALPAISAQVGKALATALHEMAHALDAGSGRSRQDDEYRASLVAACYTVDTLRPGDVMHLRVAEPPAGDVYFVEAHSRRGAARVVEDMVKAAGSRDVPARDQTAVMALKLFCGTRLSDTGNETAQPLARYADNAASRPAARSTTGFGG